MFERTFSAGDVFPVIDLAATGRSIERLRKAAGCSVRELQRAMGFSSPRAIYKWQQGQTLPTLDNMVLLSRLLGRGIEEILVFVGEEEGGSDDVDRPVEAG